LFGLSFFSHRHRCSIPTIFPPDTMRIRINHYSKLSLHRNAVTTPWQCLGMLYIVLVLELIGSPQIRPAGQTFALKRFTQITTFPSDVVTRRARCNKTTATECEFIIVVEEMFSNIGYCNDISYYIHNIIIWNVSPNPLPP